MSNSARFRTLRSRCSELRRHFIPKRFSPTGTYSARTLDLVRAYRLLAHAEVESYLEEVTQEAVLSVVRQWRTAGKLRKSLLSLVAAFEIKGGLPDVLPAAGKNTHLNDRIDLASGKFQGAAKSNNGVKAKNLLALLVPAGIEETDLDPLWVTAMENFGKNRGDVAHQSSAAKLVTYTIDPATEVTNLEFVLKGLEVIDAKLKKIVGS